MFRSPGFYSISWVFASLLRGQCFPIKVGRRGNVVSDSGMGFNSRSGVGFSVGFFSGFRFTSSFAYSYSV